MKNAHRLYVTRKKEEEAKLAREQKQKEDEVKRKAQEKDALKKAEKRRSKLDQKEKDLKEDEQKSNAGFLLAQELLRDANCRLADAIKENKITKITAASEMVTVAQKKYEEFAAHKESIEKVQNDIGKKAYFCPNIANKCGYTNLPPF